MSNTFAIARRELSSFFFSPIAYLVMCGFMLLSSLFFMLMVFAPGQPAELRYLFLTMVWILIAVVPAISMRLLSEEMRSGTIEPLMTSPVSDASVVIGKWLGGWMFFAVTLAPTLTLVALMAFWSDPDYGPIFSGYLGLLLVGGLYMAIGTFTSVLSRNQIISYLLAVFVILMLTVVTFFVPRFLPTEWAGVPFYLNVNKQYEAFSKGLVDTSNFIYFFSGITLFLVLAVKTLESRKWR